MMHRLQSNLHNCCCRRHSAFVRTKKRGLGRVEWNITYSVKGGMTTAFHSRRHRSVSLAAQVEMLNIFPRGQLGSTALTHHPAVLQDVGMASMAQGNVDVLLGHQKAHALLRIELGDLSLIHI